MNLWFPEEALGVFVAIAKRIPAVYWLLLPKVTMAELYPFSVRSCHQFANCQVRGWLSGKRSVICLSCLSFRNSPIALSGTSRGHRVVLNPIITLLSTILWWAKRVLMVLEAVRWGEEEPLEFYQSYCVDSVIDVFLCHPKNQREINQNGKYFLFSIFISNKESVFWDWLEHVRKCFSNILTNR